MADCPRASTSSADERLWSDKRLNVVTKQLQQIAERCQQGDREAFALLYTAMRQPLRTVCLSYVHDEDVADDLLHDAFLLIFYQICKLKDSARAESWMTMLTRRVALLYLRRQRRQRREPLSAYAATALQPLAVESAAESSLVVKDILAAVDALPEGYRHVFRLFVLEGMTHQEIAALLHIDPHSSSSQLYHAKALLRRWLRPMALLLLAVALPLAFFLWDEGDSPNRSDSQSEPSGLTVRAVRTDSLSRSDSKGAILKNGNATSMLAEEQHSVGNLTEDTVGSHACLIPPPIGSEKCITPRSKDDEQMDGLRQAKVPKEEETGDRIIPTKKKSGWLLAATYSGAWSTGMNNRLPYANAETNAAVYDSVACHHRPLAVGLMLNRRLGDHWQVGIGLNYQRLTSDMLSGNTYVTLSQHQVVQYIGLPVSLSWHYPPTSHHSPLTTYLSASATVSLPLRSTLESVYIIDGQSYEPTTERLHPTVQWSAGLGFGLQYNLTPHVGVFAEPGLRYHFKGSNDNVKTWNTEHPLDFYLPVGLRITF